MRPHASLLTGAVLLFTLRTVAAVADAPYPASTFARLEWGEIVRIGNPEHTGDNWPIAWIERDVQFAAYGDGRGFGGRDPRLTIGFARITGVPPSLKGEDVPTNIDAPQGGGPRGIKASGLIAVGDTLYLFVRNFRPTPEDWKHSHLASARDGGRTWTWAEWYFSDTFGVPDFVQFGPGNAGARDGFVYVISQDNDDAYAYAERTVMARVPEAKVVERASYEFFAGTDAGAAPRWSRDIAQRKPIFSDGRGTQRASITYNAALKRYLLTTSHRPAGRLLAADDGEPRKKGTAASHTAALGVFDAPEPWGPWTTLYYDDAWSAPTVTFHHKFPPAWMSADGRTLWLLFSGLGGGNYTLCTRRATLMPAAKSAPLRAR
ncbi:MAG: DUF4185 domain-containing protein [Opitutaceae bacterium]|nr:DUF4185 domain-containing protein [Opitutaceae bacterium]